MLERAIAFGVVLALLFGVAAWLNDGERPRDECPDGLGCASVEPAPVESVAPACPDGCPPGPESAPANVAPLRFEGDADDARDGKRDKDDDKEEKGEKRGKGKRGKD